MARDFTKDTANYAQFGVGTFNAKFSGAARIAFHCSFNADTLSTVAQANNRLFNVSINSTGTAALIVALRGASSNVLHIRARSTATDALQDASATTTVTTDAQHYAGAVLDYAGDTIQPYYDGVAEGGGAVTFGASTYTAGIPATNQDSIGGDATTPPTDTNRQLDGRLAEFAVWADTVPAAADFAALAKGVSPLLIARSGLIYYAPMIGDEGNKINDRITETNATITGSVPAAEHPRMFYGRKLGGIFKIAAGGTTTPITLAATVSFTAAATKQVGKNVVATAMFTPAFVKSVGMGLSATTIAIAGTTMSVGKTLAATLPFTAGITVSRAFLVTLAATVSFSAALVKSVGKVLGAAVTFTPAITDTPNVAPVVTPPSAFTGFAGLGWVHGATSRWGRRKPSWQRRK